MIPGNKHNYRPDIDGLRAVAVLLVVVYHAGFGVVSAGFVGVDVFFVISGFLITGIIKKEVEQGVFSFSRFYARRVRRLMPTLFSVILATSIFGVFILTPHDLVRLFQSIVSVIFSVSNIYFWRANGGYFDGNVLEVPLLHTWSLSVEEQYYLLWPIFLVLTARFFYKKYFLYFLILSTVISVVFSQWVSEVTFGAAYYLLPTRIFELLIGSIIALYLQDKGFRKQWVSDCVSCVGFSMILISAFCLNSGSNFPGYNALMPTIGAGIIIVSGNNKVTGIANKLLSTYPLVWVGLISYSLYLWHWPVAVFIRYAAIDFSFWVSMFILTFSILLGWCSWKYIENPFRYKMVGSNKNIILKWFVVPTLCISLLSVTIIYFEGLPERFSSNIITMEAAIMSEPAEERRGCHSPSRDSDVLPDKSCKFGDLSANKIDGLLIGDSHSNHYSGFMDVLAKDAGISIMDYTLDECLPVFDLNWGNNFYYSKKCSSRNEITKAFIKENAFRYVIVAGHWPTKNRYGYAFTNDGVSFSKDEFPDKFYRALSKSIKLINDAGSKAIVLKDSAPSGHVGPKCIIKKELFNDDLNCNIALEKVTKRDEMIDSIFDKLKIDYPDLILIDPKKVMCNDKYCQSSLDNVPLFLDQNHLNDKGSRKLGEYYLKNYPNPLNQLR